MRIALDMVLNYVVLLNVLVGVNHVLACSFFHLRFCFAIVVVGASLLACCVVADVVDAVDVVGFVFDCCVSAVWH
jgi:hypothetical protein